MRARARRERVRAQLHLVQCVDIGLAINEEHHDLRVALARCVVDGGVAVLQFPVAVSGSNQDRLAKYSTGVELAFYL